MPEHYSVRCSLELLAIDVEVNEMERAVFFWGHQMDDVILGNFGNGRLRLPCDLYSLGCQVNWKKTTYGRSERERDSEKRIATHRQDNP